MTPGRTLTLGDRQVGGQAPAYLIAEIGSNHDGHLDRALALIDECARAGVDAVKFQLFTAADLYPPNCGLIDLGDGPVDFFAVLQELEMPHAWLPDLADRATSAGVDLLMSPFSEDAVRRCAAMGLAAIKVASPELSHLPLLRAIAATGIPALLSTGMATLGDVEEAVAALGPRGGRVALMHCVTAYPAPEEDANVAAIETLARVFQVPVGLSDHTLDPVAGPMVSVAVGGKLLEKHVTYDRTATGPDHPFAIELDELSEMTRAVRAVESLPDSDRLPHCRDVLGAQRVERLLGTGRKGVQPSETLLAGCDRRAVHAVRDVPAGDVIGPSDVAVLRGERNLRPGLHPRHLDEVVGAVAQRPIPAGAGVEWGDLIERGSNEAVVAES